MSHSERFEILVLGRAVGGRLLAWHMARAVGSILHVHGPSGRVARLTSPPPNCVGHREPAMRRSTSASTGGTTQ